QLSHIRSSTLLKAEERRSRITQASTLRLRRLDSYLNTKRYSKVSLEIVWRSKRTTKMPSIIRLITRKGTSRLSICWKNWPEATRIQSKDTWLDRKSTR